MTIQELDDPTDNDNVTTCRVRARDQLTEITRQVRQALDDAGISLDVFVMIPTGGDAITTFGAAGDPPVESCIRDRLGIVGELVALARTRCREVACASTAEAILASQEGRRDGIPQHRFWPLAAASFAPDPRHDQHRPGGLAPYPGI